MRNGGPAACLQDRKAARHRDPADGAIINLDTLDVPLVCIAQRAQHEDAGEKRQIDQLQAKCQPGDRGALRRTWTVRRRKAGHHGGAQHRIPARIDDAEDREDRQGDRGGREPADLAAIPRPVAQPHVDADAAVRPHRNQQRKLARKISERVEHPEHVEHAEIGILQAVEQHAEPRIGDVRREQQRDRQAKAELPRFDGRHAQVAPPIKRPKAKAKVGEKRRQQERKSERGAPWRQDDVVADALNGIEEE